MGSGERGPSGVPLAGGTGSSGGRGARDAGRALASGVTLGRADVRAQAVSRGGEPAMRGAAGLGRAGRCARGRWAGAAELGRSGCGVGAGRGARIGPLRE